MPARRLKGSLSPQQDCYKGANEEDALCQYADSQPISQPEIGTAMGGLP